MKILMFSSDPANPRLKRYAEVLERLKIVGFERKDGRFARFWNGYRKAKEVLSKEKFDLITVQEIEHSFLAWLLSRKFKIPWQMQIHTDIFSPYYGQHSVLTRLRVLMARFLIPRASGIRVVSERIKASILQTINYQLSTISVLPIFSEIKPGGGKTDIKRKYPGYDLYILMVARLTREKNISLALKALRKIVGKGSEVLLVVVGEGPLRAKLEEEVKDGLEGNVYFEGWRDAGELSGYYESADVLLITSDYEGYSLVAVEAIGCGLPVLMTNVGVAGEVIKDGENGVVVPVCDESALAQALVKLRDDKDLRKKLSDGTRKTPRPYKSFEEYIDKLLESWRMCIEK